MDATQFDQLARQSAAGVPRRQVLKGMISLAVGTLLANFTFKSTANAYLGVSVYPAAEGTMFLPHLAKVCTEASTCDDRDGKTCGAFPDCYCLESAEGDIRCGTLPSCDVPFCTSSADCAHLGPDYFCDTPESGCCDRNSPVKHSRCIAPCDGGCSPEKLCGTNCCTDAQTCVDGACVGSYDCELDQISLVSMRAALNALAGGASSAPLTPQGCMQVHQQIVNGELVARSFTVGNRTLQRWKLEDNLWIGESDPDGDNFYEWRSVTTYGESAQDFATVETDFSGDTRQPIRRTTLTPQADAVRYVVEEYDASTEKWSVVEEYTTPGVQAASLGETRFAHHAEITPFQDATCEADPCNAEAIKQRIQEGVDIAANCLPSFGQRGVDLYMKTYDILAREMTIQCAPIDGVPQATIENWENPRGHLIVTVDPAKYCGLTDEQRGWILYHEVLHAALRRGHIPGSDALDEEHRKQIDRVYGCMAMCYNNKSDPSKCMCAQCFGTVTCDPICAAFKSDCGATCPCEASNNEYYPTCIKCLTGCPSGLNCFGYSYCNPVGQSAACPPVLCPA